LPAKSKMISPESLTATSVIGREVSVEFKFDVPKEAKPIRKVF